MENIGICSKCGNMKKLVGRGLCPACYHKDRRERNKAALVPTPRNLTVTVDFSSMEIVLGELTKRAKDELREIGPQIVWELARALQSYSRVVEQS
ncbi:MAG: hypothetical protein WAW37_05160 [Syntrophobacteraceae bacterium]